MESEISRFRLHTGDWSRRTQDTSGKPSLKWLSLRAAPFYPK
jgi:hypothetical protein